MITFNFIADANETDETYAAATTKLVEFSLRENFAANEDPKKPGVSSYSAEFTFFVYKALGKMRRGKGVIARRDYQVPADKYAAFFAPAVLRATYRGDLEAACEAYALAEKDVIKPDGTKVSFFEGGVVS